MSERRSDGEAGLESGDGDDAGTGGGDGAKPELEIPADLLAGHPTTAYFWGHVAGSGDVSAGNHAVRSDAPRERRSREQLEVTTTDEKSAQVLAVIAGGDVERDTTSREYAHDASITRTEDEYTLVIDGNDDGDNGLFGRTSTLGLPVDSRGTYRFGAFSSHDRELLRGLLEGCGTICFKSSSDTVGISFVHDDRQLLEVVRELIDDCPVDAPTGDLAETSSGGYWFGIDDAAAPAFGTWLYENCEETGLFAPSRRRKLERSLEQADAYDWSDERLE
ncbi:cobalamin biosynthesis protein [Halobacteria archaeon AArc-m2/3/4]|uniref:Cobalamin biosynthesis protein n=1 Tax=Natronoglomus mannanivorans TaxID=2979990 RepID=A0AAP2YX21_9EURY|nr:cobalamin biosynthesis protein [Halobacteria archaeon AArc-xg1-1]MCU4971441.1 cobalamin biosynthesis protein [Halobacteria archaeon AArc-m2/3/4]